MINPCAYKEKTERPKIQTLDGRIYIIYIYIIPHKDALVGPQSQDRVANLCRFIMCVFPWGERNQSATSERLCNHSLARTQNRDDPVKKRGLCGQGTWSGHFPLC